LNLQKGWVNTFVRNSTKAQKLYLNTLKSAAKEILLIFPTTNALVRQEKMGVIQLLKESAKGQKVRVRILMPVSKLTEHIVQSLTQQQQQHNIVIGCIEPTPDTEATILVVDRNVSLVIEIKDDTKDTFIEAVGLSTHSISKAGILFHVTIFENLWKQSELYQELKESHENLKMAHQKLEINNNILNNFIQSSAHELRNPIQPILGISQIIKTKITHIEERKLDVEEICSLLDVIIRNARKIHRLTDDVLDTTRIETNSFHLKIETFNLKELIQVLVDEFKSQNNNTMKNDIDNHRNIKLSLMPTITEAAQNADLFLIKADKGRISQVISNLLNNALKFTKENDIIYVNLEQKNTGSRKNFIVSIKDTGSGIDPEIFPRLFTKFATKSEKGIGLGLFICKNIIEAHGGKIWAENNAVDSKGGATFAFNLPLTVQKDNQHESMAINNIAIPMTNNIGEAYIMKKRDYISNSFNSQKTKKKRIFLVDDDYDHTITFKVGLEDAGFEVDKYNDSTIALSNFKPDYYDLLLIDIKMPKINGFELSERILKIDNKSKIWFISAYEIHYKTIIKEVSSKLKETFLDHFIQKPVEIDNLVKQVKTELY
jgi:signal transduction histidine kinase/ActR/RegA family two-component response regulator